MPKTSRRTWQKREQAAAAIFGARRQRCSGSSGIEGETRSDSTHPRLYIEHKLRAKHAVVATWGDAYRKACKERKTAVVVISQKGTRGEFVFFHSPDFPAVVANYLATLDDDSLADILYKSNVYRIQDDREGVQEPADGVPTAGA